MIKQFQRHTIKPTSSFEISSSDSTIFDRGETELIRTLNPEHKINYIFVEDQTKPLKVKISKNINIQDDLTLKIVPDQTKNHHYTNDNQIIFTLGDEIYPQVKNKKGYKNYSNFQIPTFLQKQSKICRNRDHDCLLKKQKKQQSSYFYQTLDMKSSYFNGDKIFQEKYSKIDEITNKNLIFRKQLSPNKKWQIKRRFSLPKSKVFKNKMPSQNQPDQYYSQKLFKSLPKAITSNLPPAKIINKQKMVLNKISQVSKQKNEITFRTSFLNLQDLLYSKPIKSLIIKIPKAFNDYKFNLNEHQSSISQKIKEIFQTLKINYNCLSIKKYSNCIISLTQKLSLIWHYNGKVYLGGWKNVLLDEGQKNGLGLEYMPRQYAYYGEFQKNKKNGVGVIHSKRGMLAGVWKNNKIVEIMTSQRS